MYVSKTTLLKVAPFVVLFLCMSLYPIQSKAQYTLNSEAGNLIECDTMTRGIFVIWWDKDYDYADEADAMLDTMEVFRTYCHNVLGMQDPLGPLEGYFCNIYIHNPGEADDYFFENYPDWGNGVGADVNGYAFMTLPGFVITDFSNLAHETFHIFQSHGMWDITTGLYNTNTGGWFVEAAAEWFAVSRYPDDPRTFVILEILKRVPQVPIWLDFYNAPAYYPSNWQRDVHQYALSTFLYHLQIVAGVSDSLLMSIFYSGTTLSPQQYLFEQIGGDEFRTQFIQFAANLHQGLDFVSTAQAALAQTEWNIYADEDDDNEFIQTFVDSGSDGWIQPEDHLATNAWSFNTYKLTNTVNDNYTFELKGDAFGSYGDPSYFEGLILVKNELTGPSYYPLDMLSDVEGNITIALTAADTAVYYIVASMPEVFDDTHADFQRFPYEVRITRGDFVDIDPVSAVDSKYIVARYNVLGERVQENFAGLQIVVYNDHSTAKIFVVN